MVEIAAAVSLASQTFRVLKQAVETGREMEDMAQYFGKWFEAKEQISEASMYAKNPSMVKKLFSGGSVEAQALEITAAKHKIEQMEKELREYLIWSGQTQFYDDMMIERRKIREMRLREAQRKAENKKFMQDVLIIGGICILCVFVVFGGLGVFLANS